MCSVKKSGVLSDEGVEALIENIFGRIERDVLGFTTAKRKMIFIEKSIIKKRKELEMFLECTKM